MENKMIEEWTDIFKVYFSTNLEYIFRLDAFDKFNFNYALDWN